MTMTMDGWISLNIKPPNGPDAKPIFCVVNLKYFYLLQDTLFLRVHCQLGKFENCPSERLPSVFKPSSGFFFLFSFSACIFPGFHFSSCVVVVWLIWLWKINIYMYMHILSLMWWYIVAKTKFTFFVCLSDIRVACWLHQTWLPANIEINDGLMGTQNIYSYILPI